MQGTPTTSGHNLLVFVLGLTINLLAQADANGLIDYTLKALIGGFIWLLFKLLSDYITHRLKANERASESESEEPENPNPDEQ